MEEDIKARQVNIRDLPLTWMRKILTIISFVDHDGDGIMRYEDHLKFADDIVKAGKLTGEARDTMYSMLRELCDSGENTTADIVSSTSLSTQLLEVWKHKDNPESVEKWRKMLKIIFKVLSLDTSGYMTFDNYMIFWNGLKLDKRFARMQFDYMDTDGDGLISEEEFGNACVDYHCNTDNNTFNRFYGPLVNY